YSYKVTGLQIVTFPASGQGALTVNAGKVSVRGAEIQSTYRAPIEGLTLRGAINYERGRYDDYTATCYAGQTQALGCNFGNPRFVADPARPGQLKPIYSAQNLSGTELTRAPTWTGNLGFDYERPIAERYKIGVSSDVSYSDGFRT